MCQHQKNMRQIYYTPRVWPDSSALDNIIELQSAMHLREYRIEENLVKIHSHWPIDFTMTFSIYKKLSLCRIHSHTPWKIWRIWTVADAWVATRGSQVVSTTLHRRGTPLSWDNDERASLIPAPSSLAQDIRYEIARQCPRNKSYRSQSRRIPREVRNRAAVQRSIVVRWYSTNCRGSTMSKPSAKRRDCCRQD